MAPLLHLAFNRPEVRARGRKSGYLPQGRLPGLKKEAAMEGYSEVRAYAP